MKTSMRRVSRDFEQALREKSEEMGLGVPALTQVIAIQIRQGNDVFGFKVVKKDGKKKT